MSSDNEIVKLAMVGLQKKIHDLKEERVRKIRDIEDEFNHQMANVDLRLEQIQSMCQHTDQREEYDENLHKREMEISTICNICWKTTNSYTDAL